MTFATTDYIVFVLYIASIIFMGLYVSRSKKDIRKILKIISLQVNLYLGGR